MKRLLCLLSNVNAGGAETFLMKIYRTLDKKLYQMDFCINVAEKCFYEDEINNLGGVVYRIPSLSRKYFKHKSELKKIIKNRNYEYVLKVASSPIGFLDMYIAKKSGARVCAFRSSNSRDGNSMLNKLLSKTCRFLFSKYIDVKIAPSDLSAIHTFGKKEYLNKRVNILKNGIDPEFFCFKQESRTQIRNKYNLNDKFVVGHVGRFNNQKNHSFLIDVFCEIKKIIPDSSLLLIGNGDLEGEIKEKVKKLNLSSSVVFAGVHKNVADYYSAFDVLVFPSIYEGMPNVLIEAQACGLPCLASDTITREANYLNLIYYMSLEEAPNNWASKAIQLKDNRLLDTKRMVEDAKYDIVSVANNFIEMIFD